MTTPQFLSHVRGLIARDRLPDALHSLRGLLGNTPKLDEILQLSGRLEAIRAQHRLGTVSHADATLEQNRIRYGLLELLNDIEQQKLPAAPLGELLAAVEEEIGRADLQSEMAAAVSVANSKNVVAASAINAQSVSIGDKTEVHHHYGSEKPNNSFWMKIGAVLVTVIGLLAGVAEITGISLSDIFKEKNVPIETTITTEPSKTEPLPVQMPSTETPPQKQQPAPKKTQTTPRNHFESHDSSKQINIPDNHGTININQ